MINLKLPNMTGSLRQRANEEIKAHRRENKTLRRHRYALSIVVLRYAMAEHTFGWFIALYLFGLIFAIPFEAGFMKFGTMFVGPRTPLEGIELKESLSLLKDITSYLLAAQVGVLGVISIAVGLVTIIGQRDDSPVDVLLYYHESLVYEVTASSIALGAVLTVQLFWPMHHLWSLAEGGHELVASRWALTFLHAAWLTLNLVALANFIACSLRFVEPGARAQMRERFSANTLIPIQEHRDLLTSLYLSARRSPNSGIPEGCITFGFGFQEDTEVEISSDFGVTRELYDVRMSLVWWAIKRWWARCLRSDPHLAEGARSGERRFDKVQLIFPVVFGQTYDGDTALCLRRGGVPLDRIEKIVLRASFRFAQR